MSQPRVASARRSCVYSFGQTAMGTRLRLPGERLPQSIANFSQGVRAILDHATGKGCKWSRDDVQAFLHGPVADRSRCVLTGAEIESWLEGRFPGR